MASEMEKYLPAAHDLNQTAKTERELENLLIQGFSRSALDGLRALSLTDAEIALYVEHAATLLGTEDSKSALRAAYIVRRATEVFKGNGDKALVWLRETNERLDNRSPLAVAHSEAGLGHVESLLMKVALGQSV